MAKQQLDNESLLIKQLMRVCGNNPGCSYSDFSCSVNANAEYLVNLPSFESFNLGAGNLSFFLANIILVYFQKAISVLS